MSNRGLIGTYQSFLSVLNLPHQKVKDMLTDPVRSVDTDEEARLALCTAIHTYIGAVGLEKSAWIEKGRTIDPIGVRLQTNSPTGKRYAY